MGLCNCTAGKSHRHFKSVIRLMRVAWELQLLMQVDSSLRKWLNLVVNLNG